MKTTIGIKTRDILRIAAEGNLHPRTVTRVLSGQNHTENSLEAVKDAAKKLGISLPSSLTSE